MGERIDRVLKYYYNDQEIWIYSVKDTDENNNSLFKYYSLFLKDKEPVITDIENPIETLQNINIPLQEVIEGTTDYLIFMTYKDVADKKLMNAIKR